MRERAGFEQDEGRARSRPRPRSLRSRQRRSRRREKLASSWGPVRKDIASKIAKARESFEAQRD